MGKFNRGGSFGGKRDRGERGFSDRRKERPTMHSAVCGECGKDCEVPFRPTGDKPVYCSDCFRNKGGSESRGFERNRDDSRSFDRRDSGRSSFGEKEMFEAVCSKCGESCEVPFRPTGDKPVYCSDCFSKTDRPERSERPKQDNKQIEAINAKLDQILKLLNPAGSEKKETAKPKALDLNIFDEKEVAKPKKETKGKEKKAKKEEKVAPVKKEKAKKKK